MSTTTIAATKNKPYKSAHARHGGKSRRVQFIILCFLVPLFVMPFYVMIMAALNNNVASAFTILTGWIARGMGQTLAKPDEQLYYGYSSSDYFKCYWLLQWISALEIHLPL
jgi:hypothetical protein